MRVCARIQKRKTTRWFFLAQPLISLMAASGATARDRRSRMRVVIILDTQLAIQCYDIASVILSKPFLLPCTEDLGCLLPRVLPADDVAKRDSTATEAPRNREQRLPQRRVVVDPTAQTDQGGVSSFCQTIHGRKEGGTSREEDVTATLLPVRRVWRFLGPGFGELVCFGNPEMQKDASDGRCLDGYVHQDI